MLRAVYLYVTIKKNTHFFPFLYKLFCMCFFKLLRPLTFFIIEILSLFLYRKVHKSNVGVFNFPIQTLFNRMPLHSPCTIFLRTNDFLLSLRIDSKIVISFVLHTMNVHSLSIHIFIYFPHNGLYEKTSSFKL